MTAPREYRLTQAEYDRLATKDRQRADRIIVDGIVVKNRNGPCGGAA
jgi:replicative DNA helicase